MNSLDKNFYDSSQKYLDNLHSSFSPDIIDKIEDLAKHCLKCWESEKNIFICGNGGSAAEAEHFAAELVCKFQKVRKALPAITLHSNIPTVTAIGNDFKFEDIFSRNLEAFGDKNDILIALSTSGNSQNVINALKLANEMQIYSFTLTGNDGGVVKSLSDDFFLVQSNVVSTIQEIHLMFLHALCNEIDRNEF